jgi:hypothetical protein
MTLCHSNNAHLQAQTFQLTQLSHWFPVIDQFRFSTNKKNKKSEKKNPNYSENLSPLLLLSGPGGPPRVEALTGVRARVAVVVLTRSSRCCALFFFVFFFCFSAPLSLARSRRAHPLHLPFPPPISSTTNSVIP